MFERFYKNPRVWTKEKIETYNWQWQDFTYLESQFIIYLTIMEGQDKLMAKKIFLELKNTERVANEISFISTNDLKISATSKRTVENHVNNKIEPAFKNTVKRILPYWNENVEQSYIEIINTLIELQKLNIL